jgi:peptidoglycan/LPS O-acetylase OafA/YrhL
VTGGSRGEVESAPLGGGAYVPTLDGIRALAVAAVLAFHGGVPHTSGGYLGVSLFFTLSGFLLTAVLLRERAGTGRISMLRFWERRFRRLLPAAIVTLAAIALLAPRLDPAGASRSLRFDVLSALGYLRSPTPRSLRSGGTKRSTFGSSCSTQ